ncbi:MAG TPA: calcium/proton exchanger [Dehalococcoidia bacterium]|nr:calcium/proton exchanger [Dehalococcoidia bacterium]
MRNRRRIGVRRVFFILIVVLTLLALGARIAGAPAPLIFGVAALAMALLAWLVGVATEELGAAAGPKVSGVLNASFGNIAELIITIFALRAGLTTVVKASITGSILGNMLLVLGLSLILAGMRHGELKFSRTMAATNASLLMIAVIGLAVPAVFARTAPPVGGGPIEHLSIGVAAILLLAYALSLLFFFQTPKASGAELTKVDTEWSVQRSVIVLAVAAVGITVVSDVLVDAIRPTLAATGMSELFAGIIIIPIIGNIAEHVVGMQLAYQNDMDFSLVISLGSSLQIALFVGPLLVFLSLLVGNPMDLVFTPLELVTVGFGVLTVALVVSDGESNWLEGVELVAVYAIVALAFLFYPR